MLHIVGYVLEYFQSHFIMMNECDCRWWRGCVLYRVTLTGSFRLWVLLRWVQCRCQRWRCLCAGHKGVWVCWCVAPFSLTLNSIWRWMVSVTPQPLITGKITGTSFIAGWLGTTTSCEGRIFLGFADGRTADRLDGRVVYWHRGSTRLGAVNEIGTENGK